MTPTSKAAQAMTDAQLLAHFDIPGLNLEATLDRHDLGLLFQGIRDLLAAQPSQAQAAEAVISADKCAQDVYKNGQSIGYFDIPKETANAICAGIQAVTGARVDWHYFAGRVHMKALPASPVASEREGLTVQDVRLLLIRHADSYAEWDDATLEKVDFGQYGFLAFARALATRTGSDK